MQGVFIHSGNIYHSERIELSAFLEWNESKGPTWYFYGYFTLLLSGVI